MTIERVTQLIKGGFAYRADRELGFHPPFWQKGFSETRVFDANSFANHVEYNHSNPVTRHLVESKLSIIDIPLRIRGLSSILHHSG
jgi:REP-associated tyrosine transposase